jgi:hypothetical protein
MIIITFSMAVLWQVTRYSYKVRDIISSEIIPVWVQGAAVPAPGGLDLELVSATE